MGKFLTKIWVKFGPQNSPEATKWLLFFFSNCLWKGGGRGGGGVGRGGGRGERPNPAPHSALSVAAYGSNSEYTSFWASYVTANSKWSTTAWMRHQIMGFVVRSTFIHVLTSCILWVRIVKSGPCSPIRVNRLIWAFTVHPAWRPRFCTMLLNLKKNLIGWLPLIIGLFIMKIFLFYSLTLYLIIE